MKKLFTILMVSGLGTMAFGQTIFQSNLSSWSGGNPTDWMGSKTTIAQSNVVEQTVGATYGTSTASLINTTTSHKRFTTQPVAVTPGETYEIEMWVAGSMGELRTNFYDTTNAAYGPYNPYIDMSVVSAGSLTLVSQTVTMPAGCNYAEFILSLRNTDPATAGTPLFLGIIVDSVAISVTTPPVATPVSIYDIQYTTATPADSPYNTQLVETKGVCTAIQYNGYYLQDGNGPWNGVFVLDFTNTPNRGDSVFVTGLVDEYFNYTTVKNISVYNAIPGGSLPNVSAITTLAANDEQYEGVLINVTNATCTADTAGSGFGEWTVNDGSGAVIVDDKMYPYGPTLSTMYNVTGVMDYSFNAAKILPRDMNDISVATSVKQLEESKTAVYPNPTSGVLNFVLEENKVSVNIIDMTGKTLKSIKANANKFSISLDDLANGIYFYSIIDAKEQTIATNRFVVAK